MRFIEKKGRREKYHNSYDLKNLLNFSQHLNPYGRHGRYVTGVTEREMIEISKYLFYDFIVIIILKV